MVFCCIFGIQTLITTRHGASFSQQNVSHRSEHSMLLFPNPYSVPKSHQSIYCKEHNLLNLFPPPPPKKTIWDGDFGFHWRPITFSAPVPHAMNFFALFSPISFRPEIASFALGVWGIDKIPVCSCGWTLLFPQAMLSLMGLLHPSRIGRWVLGESLLWCSNPPSWAPPSSEHLLWMANRLESCLGLFPGGLDRDPEFRGRKP